jgi:cytochrome c-type biogenesis protein CcmH/NrfG
VLALGCLFVIAWPLAETTALRASQAAARTGATATALSDAQAAARLESGAAAPQLQQALVLETERQFTAAIAHARKATVDDPLDWSNWVVLSRLEAEAGNATSSLQAYERAKSLNPKSPLLNE